MSESVVREPPVVPGYTLENLLGRGGSGEVWRAVPRRGGPPVAVKVLVAGDPDRQAREAALLGVLDHPHLVRLHEVVHQPRRGGQPRVALVLDLLPGGSLAALLARRGRLRPGEVVTAIAPVAAALAHAHEHGIVHGDLSPGNIVFTADGRPVLTDLGVARVLGETAAAEVTPAYVDPTVARGGAPGPASDVFGVAAAAFHALTGVAPWNAATPADTLTVAAAGLLPDLEELAPGTPAELLAVVRRGLAADPADRGSAAAFALDLRHACRPEPVRLPVPGVPDAELGRTGRGPRTELTHQVPGRRPRPAPPRSDPAPRARRRATLTIRPGLMRRLVTVAGVAGGLAAAVWLGTHWGGSSAEQAPASASTPAVGEAAPLDRDALSGGLPERDAVPTTAAGWQELLGELYARRAQAFGTGSVEPLDGVYTGASALRSADEQFLAGLAAAGEVLRDFTPVVVAVSGVRPGEGRVVLDLVDRWPDHAVVPAAAPDGPALRSVPGRGEATVRMTLVRTGQGWRIDTAERRG
jgi:hypothetical protein